MIVHDLPEELVVKIYGSIERNDGDALILTVRANVVAVERFAADKVGREDEVGVISTSRHRSMTKPPDDARACRPRFAGELPSATHGRVNAMMKPGIVVAYIDFSRPNGDVAPTILAFWTTFTSVWRVSSGE